MGNGKSGSGKTLVFSKKFGEEMKELELEWQQSKWTEVFSSQIYSEDRPDQWSVYFFIKQLFIARCNTLGTLLGAGDTELNRTYRIPDLKELTYYILQ